ncbi:MAG: hypothetical protein HY721_19880 [Planctomycetes bacterium]|nr:hypothetical protein [Planctomycetota bacterium]
MKPSGRPSAHGLASLSVCAFALAALEPSGPALAQFSFVKVVGIGDPSPAGAPFVALAYPKLNDRGQIAFLGYAGASFPGTKGLFLVRGSEIEKVALEGDAAPGGGTFTFDYVNLDLNDQGQVAFVTGAGGGAHAIFLYSLGNLSQVVRTGDIPSGAFTSLDNPAINNSGEIAFTGGYPQGGGIFKVGIAGGPAAKVWIKGDNAPSGGTFESTLRPPAINDAGQVAAEAGVVGDFTLQDGTPFSGQLSGIFVGGAGQPKRIALAGVNTDGGVFAPPDLSSGGDLAYGFESSFVPPRWRLYRGSLQKVAATGDGTPAGGKFGLVGLGLLRPDRLNDRGQIVFDATVDGGSSPLGIFISQGGGSVKVVAVGDPTPQGGVFGELSSPTINDLGCIAFVGLTRFLSSTCS